ncbi:MAG: hypothetical protein M3235_16160, partial [Actinomycetota bacterium]|nr:hypothetical protein [Actinomycetota bacterium]
MTATADHGTPGPGAGGGAESGLALIREGITRLLGSSPEGCGRAELIDQISEMETLKNSVEAAQADATLAFARAEVA